MLRLCNYYQKFAGDLLEFARPFIDFARAPDLIVNPQTNITYLWVHHHIVRIKKKPYLFVHLNLLDIARVFWGFARTPAALGGGSQFGVSNGTLFDSKNIMLN